MNGTIADKSQGYIITPHGDQVEKPTTHLSAEAAKILRNYFHWIISQQLEPELYCAACWDGRRESKAQYFITDHEIAIICNCQLRYFAGEWVKPAAITPNVSIPDDTAGPSQARISIDGARLLRLWKKVLEGLGLKEALRCNACYALNTEDGCDAQVNDSSIRIRCRCSHRTYVGMTI